MIKRHSILYWLKAGIECVDRKWSTHDAKPDNSQIIWRGFIYLGTFESKQHWSFKTPLVTKLAKTLDPSVISKLAEYLDTWSSRYLRADKIQGLLKAREEMVQRISQQRPPREQVEKVRRMKGMDGYWLFKDGCTRSDWDCKKQCTITLTNPFLYRSYKRRYFKKQLNSGISSWLLFIQCFNFPLRNSMLNVNMPRQPSSLVYNRQKIQRRHVSWCVTGIVKDWFFFSWPVERKQRVAGLLQVLWWNDRTAIDAWSPTEFSVTSSPRNDTGKRHGSFIYRHLTLSLGWATTVIFFSTTSAARSSDRWPFWSICWWLSSIEWKVKNTVCLLILIHW